MTVISIRKEMKTFDAAHQLPQHEMQCKHLHGHTYRVFVEVTGPINKNSESSEFGMVIDFGVLKDIYEQHIHARVDHAFMLGEYVPKWVQAIEAEGQGSIETWPEFGKVARLPIPTTTAEHLALWIYEMMSRELAYKRPELDCVVQSVTVFETPTSSATATGFTDYITSHHG